MSRNSNMQKNVPARPERSNAAQLQPDAVSNEADTTETATTAAPADTAGAEDEGEVTRENRRPFGTQRQKLAYPQRKGYHRHWFNDIPGRVPAALAAGYKHVKGDDGRNVTRVVGVREGGGGLVANLMEIPEEWFQEDQAAKQRVVDEVDASIRKGTFEQKPGDERYVKNISIQRR